MKGDSAVGTTYHEASVDIPARFHGAVWRKGHQRWVTYQPLGDFTYWHADLGAYSPRAWDGRAAWARWQNRAGLREKRCQYPWWFEDGRRTCTWTTRWQSHHLRGAVTTIGQHVANKQSDESPLEPQPRANRRVFEPINGSRGELQRRTPASSGVFNRGHGYELKYEQCF